MQNNNISEHISWKEATLSPTGVRLGIENIPNDTQIANMKKLAEVIFEPLRGLYGKPITVDSFFRCPALNKAIGGSTTSQHMTGQAIDIAVGDDNSKLFDLITNNFHFDQLIAEGIDDQGNINWIHVSYNEGHNRNQIIIMCKDKDGKNQYYDYNPQFMFKRQEYIK